MFGLEEALQDYTQKWSTLSHIPIDLEFSGVDTDRLPAEFEITLYRIVQEALTDCWGDYTLAFARSTTWVMKSLSWPAMTRQSYLASMVARPFMLSV